MLPSIVLVATLLVSFTSAYPATRFARRDVDPSLVPEFGVTPGQNPTGTGDCSGSVPGVEIPCDCPPPRDLFLKDLNANIAAGHCVNNTAVKFVFPTDDSIQSQISRINGVLVTLQNLRGPGVGCPAVSTNLLPIEQALQAQLAGKPAPKPTPTPTPAPTPAQAPVAASVKPKTSSSSTSLKPTPTPAASSSASSTASTSGTPSAAQIAATAPDLGFTAGLDPTGTGNCQGAIPGGPKFLAVALRIALPSLHRSLPTSMLDMQSTTRRSLLPGLWMIATLVKLFVSSRV